MNKVMLTATGSDQTGIVSRLTKVFLDKQCNLEDASMTQLEDHFTVMLIVLVPPTCPLQELEQALRDETESLALQLNLYKIDTTSETATTSGNPWTISVSGPDQTGIMYHVSCYLAQHRVNIRSLSSKRLSTTSGRPVFLMALEVDVPSSVDDKQFETDLAKLGESVQQDIHAEPLEVYTL